MLLMQQQQRVSGTLKMGQLLSWISVELADGGGSFSGVLSWVVVRMNITFVAVIPATAHLRPLETESPARRLRYGVGVPVRRCRTISEEDMKAC